MKSYIFGYRNPILLADETYYGGNNKCLIWRGFAKRGLGLNANEDGFLNQNYWKSLSCQCCWILLECMEFEIWTLQ